LPQLRGGMAQRHCRERQPRSAEGDVGHRALPHGGARRPCRALRRLRPYCHCLQQLPQSALPQVSGRRQGVARRAEAELLPVGYFHLVFTLPGPIADIAYHNKAAIYGLLLTAAAEATPLRSLSSSITPSSAAERLRRAL